MTFKNQKYKVIFFLSILKLFLVFLFPLLTFLQDKIGKKGFLYFGFEILIIYFFSLIIKNKKISYIFNSVLIFLGLFNFVILFFSNTFLNLEMVTNVTNLHGIKGNAFVYIISIISIFLISFLPVLDVKINFLKPVYLIGLVTLFILFIFTKFYDYSPYFAYMNLIKDGLSFHKIYSEITKEQQMIHDGSLKSTFEKEKVENYFEKPTSLSKNPNVILIFTEGLSEHIIFDERNIMPNVKKFAENSFRFSNYYNHTFATYMGIIGQLFSGYQHNHYDKNNLVSLQSILKNKEKYSTHFINTEPNNNEFTIYLENLGFDTVYSNKDLVDDLKNKTLSDKVAYDTLFKYIENLESTNPYFICMYTYGTHATLNSPNIKFKDGKNPLLNKFHSSDYWFGDFFEKYKNSSISKDTILVYTADHATALDNDFLTSFPEYKRTAFALDKIPFIIYHEDVGNDIYDVNGRNSLSLVPTILDYLDISDKNYFLGDSLFNKNSNNIYDTKFQSYANLYTTANNQISVLEDFDFEKKITQYFAIKSLGEKNSDIKANYVNASFNKIANKCVLNLSIVNPCDNLNIAIWSKKNGQDDLRWFTVKNAPEVDIDFSKFSEKGTYLIDVYLVNDGKKKYCTGTTLFID